MHNVTVSQQLMYIFKYFREESLNSNAVLHRWRLFFAGLCGVNSFVDCYTQRHMRFCCAMASRLCTSALCSFRVVFFLTVWWTDGGSTAPRKAACGTACGTWAVLGRSAVRRSRKVRSLGNYARIARPNRSDCALSPINHQHNFGIQSL